jgi:hypothetical protein
MIPEPQQRPCDRRLPLSPEEEELVADLVADGLSLQHEFRPEPLHKQKREGHNTNLAPSQFGRKQPQHNDTSHE